MSRYREAANGTFPYKTRSLAFSVFADVLEPTRQEIRPYRTFTHPATCHLQVLVHPSRRTVFVMTEMKENEGQSVTNAAEALATQLVEAFNVSPSSARFIEHFTPDSYTERNPQDGETYDEVTFTETVQ